MVECPACHESEKWQKAVKGEDSKSKTQCKACGTIFYDRDRVAKNMK